MFFFSIFPHLSSFTPGEWFDPRFDHGKRHIRVASGSGRYGLMGIAGLLEDGNVPRTAASAAAPFESRSERGLPVGHRGW